MTRIYLYVDGESHYAMSEKCFKDIHGDSATLASVVSTVPEPSHQRQYHRIFHDADSKFFWDTHVPRHSRGGTEMFPNFDLMARRVYFTALVGNDPKQHEAKVFIRNAGFEPQVIREEKDLAQQRANRLRSDGVLIKGKGVDISLAVRMLEDAYYNNYDECYLATSDVDYLPAIQAVRRLGKQVFVFGYKEGIAKDSAFLHAVEKFIDLGEFVRANYTAPPAS